MVFIIRISLNSNIFIIEWEMGRIIGINIVLPIIVDQIRLYFSLCVIIISRAVLIFSSSYMSQDAFFTRFHFLVYAFVASMLLLIFSPNLLRVLLGWDGLGVTSFLLVVYYQRDKANRAGILTAMTNRVGDIIILLAIALLVRAGSWNVFFCTDILYKNYLLLAFLLTIRACTKRAQIPFSAWLPAAIAAPTPVSSLVHSSTLVTAGIYIMIRIKGWLTHRGAMHLILFLGFCTTILAGVSALLEIDIKKIIALSTLSQLGLIAIRLGRGLWTAAFVHLISHAFFKALIFITIGSCIHLSSDYQDLRKISLDYFSKMALGFNLCANLRLCGIPFTSGFYSKDWILERIMWRNYSWINYLITILAVALTSAYSSRLILARWKFTKINNNLSNVVDKDSFIFIRVLRLSPLSTIRAFFLIWALNLTSNFPVIPGLLKVWTLMLIGLGIGVGAFLSNKLSFPNSLYFSWSWGSIWSLPFIRSTGLIQFGRAYSYISFLSERSWNWWRLIYSIIGNSFWDFKTLHPSRQRLWRALPLSSIFLVCFMLY